MSGTPEKILEHMLETIKLETNGSDFIGIIINFLFHFNKEVVVDV